MKGKVKRNIVVILGLISILLFSGTVSAWGPHTHTYLTEKLFDNPTGIVADYAEYEREFLAGTMIPDISVAYYFAEGGTKYRATHNWNFQMRVMQQAQNDAERAFAYGIASHLIADSVSHTMCIPERIEAYRLPNWLIHPLTEKKYDSLLALNNPGLKDRSKHMLDAVLYGEDHVAPGDTLASHNAKVTRYHQMIEGALDDKSFDVEENLIRLAAALDSFYKDGKAPDGAGLFALYPYIDALTDFIHPLAGGSMPQVAFYVDKAFDENKAILTSSNWGTRTLLSPHGFNELNAADEKAVNVFHLFLFAYAIMMFALPIFMMWWRRDKRFLALIPLMFFIACFILMAIYIMV